MNQQEVFNYYSGHISNVMHGKNKPREMPKDSEGDKFHIGRFDQREREDEPVPRGVPSQQRTNTFAMAGRAQLADGIAKRKEKEVNPLDSGKVWQVSN